MDGMGMLLKAAGFDPAQFQDFISGLQLYMRKINEDLELVKQQQEKLLAILEKK